MLRAFESRANLILRSNAKNFSSMPCNSTSGARSACCNSGLETDENTQIALRLVPLRNRVE